MVRLPTGLDMNELDIASANVALMLVQFVIDKLIEKKVATAPEVEELFIEMRSSFRLPGDPRRKAIRDAAAEFFDQALPKYAALSDQKTQ